MCVISQLGLPSKNATHGWLKQQRLIFLTLPSGGQEVPDLGHGSLVFLVGALLLAYSRYLLAVSSYGRDGREQKEGEGDGSQMSFLVRTLMPSD